VRAVTAGAGDPGRPDRRSPAVGAGEKVVKAQILDRPAELSNRVRIAAELGLRVEDADLHGAGLRRGRDLHRGFFQSCRCRFSRGNVVGVRAGCRGDGVATRPSTPEGPWSGGHPASKVPGRLVCSLPSSVRTWAAISSLV
jgi:hypothetical protein